MTMPPRPCRAKAAPAPANPAPNSTASSGMNGKIAATPADSSSTGRNTGIISPRRVAEPGTAWERLGGGLRAIAAQRRTSSAFICRRASSTAATVWSTCASLWTALTMNAPPIASTPRLSSARLNGSL